MGASLLWEPTHRGGNSIDTGTPSKTREVLVEITGEGGPWHLHRAHLPALRAVMVLDTGAAHWAKLIDAIESHDEIDVTMVK